MNMTEIEARGKIKYRIANEMRKYGENKEEYEDLEIALQVMKEIREYRAVGTVEEITNLIKFLSFDDDTSILEDLRMLVEYYAIGTVEELKALKEKSVAKKMLHNGVNWYRCPNGCEIHKKQFEKDWYCPKCGQKLKWVMKGGATDERNTV